jgi:CYTH domain-containing protein/predicted ATPase
MNQAKFTKIALTGGPCAGKTTILSHIVTHFSERGYRVVVVPESATLIIQAGFGPKEFPDEAEYHFQEAIGDVILRLEDSMERLSKNTRRPVLMVCDRGMMDAKAYCTEQVWERILARRAIPEATLRDSRYHAVLHLVTAAEGAEAFYSTANNTARLEDPAQAREVDRRLRNAWTGHPHYRIIDNSTNFAGKIRRSLEVIQNVVGLTEPLEIERKFVLKEMPEFPPEISVVTSKISQIYLLNNEHAERVRSREYPGVTTYTHTVKKRSLPDQPSQMIEIESIITPAEYREFLKRRDPKKGEVEKRRHCFVWHNHQFEVDEYLGRLAGRVVAEVETEAADEKVDLPDFLKITEEVTGNDAWSNSQLAFLAAR